MDTDDLKLSILNVSASYQSHQVLKQVTATVVPGEVVALIGPNGAGKTTLIKAISGIVPITQGSIHIDGQDLLRLNAQERAKLVAVIPQARNLPPAYTAREVVLMGRTPYVGWLGKVTKQDELIVEHAMRRTRVDELENRRMDELSGGEQQRVLVARAIAQDPKILLLDEPTTHLDIQFQTSLLEMIHSLAHQDHLAVLMAIHDLNLAARFADRVILLVKGEIRASGKQADVLSAELLSSAYQVPITLHETQQGYHFITPY